MNPINLCIYDIDIYNGRLYHFYYCEFKSIMRIITLEMYSYENMQEMQR